VITRVDDRLTREARATSLRFRCEECAHFALDTAACGNGYPVDAHRGIDLASATEIVFCKDFELG
jgi:hypothetical protein